MTTEELDRLAELEAKATRGPWVLEDLGPCDGEQVVTDCSQRDRLGRLCVIDDCGVYEYVMDQEFIAALRNAAPALIALAEWAEKSRRWIDEESPHNSDRASECGKCKLLAAYPEGE